jgi:hypothetical protein
MRSRPRAWSRFVAMACLLVATGCATEPRVPAALPRAMAGPPAPAQAQPAAPLRRPEAGPKIIIRPAPGEEPPRPPPSELASLDVS